MTTSESPRRRRKVKKATSETPMTPQEKADTRRFLMFALGDPNLTAFEENFLNHIKQLMRYNKVHLTERQAAVLEQIKAKSGFDRPDIHRHDHVSEPDDEDIVEAEDRSGDSEDWMDDPPLWK